MTGYAPLALLRGRTDRVARAARLTAAVFCAPRSETLREAMRAAIARRRHSFVGGFPLKAFPFPQHALPRPSFDARAHLGLMVMHSMQRLRGR